MPIQTDFGRFEKLALEIVEAHVAQGGAAPDRAFDAADLDPQATRRTHVRDAIGDQAVPGLRVDAPQGDEEQRDQPDYTDPERAEHAPAAAWPWGVAPRRGDRLGLVRHQKA